MSYNETLTLISFVRTINFEEIHLKTTHVDVRWSKSSRHRSIRDDFDCNRCPKWPKYHLRSKHQWISFTSTNYSQPNYWWCIFWHWLLDKVKKNENKSSCFCYYSVLKTFHTGTAKTFHHLYTKNIGKNVKYFHFNSHIASCTHIESRTENQFPIRLSINHQNGLFHGPMKLVTLV